MDDKPEKERSEIPEPAPLTVGNVRYEAVPFGRARGLPHNGGYVAAIDTASGRELWLLEIYNIVYDNEREQDKQDVFIEELALDAAGRLRVNDERGGIYFVDLKTRQISTS